MNFGNVLVVFALEAESQGRFADFNLLISGVGKVNAAYHLTRKLAEWGHQKKGLPKLVLNLGTAGSTQFKAGSIVNCTRFIQRDIDATALGFELHATPYDNTPVSLANGARYGLYPEGICGTGDIFSTTGATATISPPS